MDDGEIICENVNKTELAQESAEHNGRLFWWQL